MKNGANHMRPKGRHGHAVTVEPGSVLVCVPSVCVQYFHRNRLCIDAHMHRLSILEYPLAFQNTSSSKTLLQSDTWP